MTDGKIFDIKKFAVHDGPGIRTTVFFKGCPLDCTWCHNPEGVDLDEDLFFYESRCIGCGSCIDVCPQDAIKKGEVITLDRTRCDVCGRCVELCPTNALKSVGERVSVDEVMDEIESSTIYHDTSGGGVTFSGGEPFLQFGFLEELIERCDEEDIHIAIDTCGDVEPKKFDSIMDQVDLFLFDLKMIDDDVHREHTGSSNRYILRNLEKVLSRGKTEVILRIPLIPDISDTEKNLESILDFLSPFKSVKEIHLLPYHDVKEKYNRLGKEYHINIDKGDELTRKKLERIKKMFEEEGYSVKEGG